MRLIKLAVTNRQLAANDRLFLSLFNTPPLSATERVIHVYKQITNRRSSAHA